MASIRIGIDIGGTFTDLQGLDEQTGATWSLKTPTTPSDPSLGLLTGIEGAAARFGFALPDIRLLLHGTTIATNAVLERRLPRGVLLTTEGFRDVLEIGRHARRDVYGLHPHKEQPLIPRERRVEVRERMRADGTAELPLAPEAVAAAVAAVRAAGAETVAIALLNSNTNPAHELALRDAIRAALPDLPVSVSAEVSPEIREYERTSTAVLNALLMPVVRSYIARLEARLAGAGIAARLLLVQSNGGVCAPRTAAAQPVRLLLSGPSGGANGAQALAARLAEPDLVGVDMGGTSFDVCVVSEGRVALTVGGEVDHLPVRLPMVEIRTIGAGGGSVATVEDGRLRVGPRSAGARPGPACYGHGGTEPTVTDANLALGRLDPAFFLGGAMALDAPAARAALGRVAAPLGLSPEQAAEGILTLTNTSLAAATRLSLFEKGLDPRRFAMVSFGGAGGLHAVPVAAELGMRRVLFPADASTFSAGGILRSAIAHDLAASLLRPATPGTVPALAAAAAALRAEGTALLESDGVLPPDRELALAVDMRYRGQAFELVTPWQDAAAPVDEAALAALLHAFHALHERRFSYSNPSDPAEIVTLRLSAIGRLPRIPDAPSTRPDDAPPTTRPVFLGGAWLDVPVHRRAAVAAECQGPALVESDDTTVLIPPGWRFAPLPSGELLATADAGAACTQAEDATTPVGLEVLRNALSAAAAEMDVTVWRTSRSTVVRELLDYSTAIFDRHGENVAQSARIPQHLNSMGAGLQTIAREHVPLATWQEGDVVVTNDPYSGGQHIPDLLAFRPVFADGALVAVVGTLCHHLDMGGIAAGSYGATATELVQEGLRIPPMKLVRQGRIDEGVLAVMRANVRRPDMLMGDLQAQLASLAVGEAAIRAVAARIGAPALVEGCRTLLNGSERAMRAAIARIPDGRHEWEDWIDDDGLTDTPIRVHAAVTISGETMVVDLSGSGNQALGPINATLASSSSAVAYAVMAACADPAGTPIPANAGCMRPVTTVAREGSVVHARHPAPVANRIAATHRLATTILGALHAALPGRIPAAYYGTSYVCTFQTVRDDGSRAVLVEIEVGGAGAHPSGDGNSAFSAGMHNNSNIPAEMVESELPLTVTEYAILPGTGGAGRFRGGDGLVREWRVDCPEAVFTANGERFRFAPYGLAGGAPGSLGRLFLVRDGVRQALPSKVGNLRLRRGDRIRLETSGGGGFGVP